MSMEAIYSTAQTTRQAFCKWLLPSEFEQRRISEQEIVQIARQVRKNHLPGSCSRTVYAFIRERLPEESGKLIGCGKHYFEQVCLANGLRIEHKSFVPKTTEKGDFVFKNSVSGTIINDVNQVWVCDISYIFGSEGKLLGYSTAVIDLYSKYLLGLHFSPTMHAAVTAQVAVEKALQVRKIAEYKQLIFHTDGGKQFIEGKFLKTLKAYGIKSSMAANCYENASAEAFNDSLKNHLLIEYDLNSYSQLKHVEDKLEYCYNFNKPHSSLAGLTPVQFEQEIQNLSYCKRPQIKVADPK